MAGLHCGPANGRADPTPYRQVEDGTGAFRYVLPVGLGVTVAVALAVILLAWASFWAALAANVGMSRGAPASVGLRWGLLLGPFGVAIVMARTRGGGRGLDGRVASGRDLAGQYRVKAERSVQAWRGTTGDRLGSPSPSPSPSSGRPDPASIPPPTWGPPPPGAPPGSPPTGPQPF